MPTAQCPRLPQPPCGPLSLPPCHLAPPRESSEEYSLGPKQRPLPATPRGGKGSPLLQGTPKLSPAGPHRSLAKRVNPSAHAPSPGQPGGRGWGELCCIQGRGPPFAISKAKERRGRCSCSPQPHSALTVLPAQPGAERRFLRPGPAPVPQRMLRGSASSSRHLQLPNNSLQGSQWPWARETFRSSSGWLVPAQGPGRYPGGRERVVRGSPPCSGPLLGGGGEGSMQSALRNVLWENAEAVIPSYFPWPMPRYSAGPLHSQARPCRSTSDILGSGH